MKKILENLRSRSHATRMIIVMVVSACMTAFIGIGWVMSLDSRYAFKNNTPDTVKPINALTSSIKQVLQKDPQKQSVEIVNQSNNDTLYDETNPYQQ